MLITARRREFHAEEHAKENGRMMDRLRTAHVSGGREKDDKTTSIPAKRSVEAESEGGNVRKSPAQVLLTAQMTSFGGSHLSEENGEMRALIA